MYATYRVILPINQFLKLRSYLPALALRGLKHTKISVINITILMKTMIFPKGFHNAELLNT